MPSAKNSTSGSVDPEPAPDRYILSNGRYGTVVTGDGSGFSWFDGRSLTQWSRDPLIPEAGFVLYLRESGQDGYLILGHPSDLVAGSRHRCRREPGRTEITQRFRGLEVSLDTCVAPSFGANAGFELRRLRLRNLTPATCELEVTSYGEVALHDPSAHAAHPAFSRLFVHSEFVAERTALLFRRRPRGEGDLFPWMVHALVGSDPVEYETDRARFLGRGRDATGPLAMLDRHSLAGTAGDVLDPVFALRMRLLLPPGGAAERTFLLGAADGPESALALTELPGSAATEPRPGTLPLVRLDRDAASATAVASIFAAAESDEARGWRVLGLDSSQATDLNRIAASLLCNPAGAGTEELAAFDLDLIARYWETLHPPVDIDLPHSAGVAEQA